MDDGVVSIEMANERVKLTPQRALWWPAGQTLFVADIHVGRIATLRARGVPIPGDTLGAMLDRLADLLAWSDPDRLVVLGDLVQQRAGLTDSVVGRTREVLTSWDGACQLVEGNHDRRAAPLPEAWPLQLVESGEQLGPFILRHEPTPADTGYTLAGHLHPTVQLEAGSDSLRLPCFSVGEDLGVLPAFHSVTNGVQVTRGDSRLFALADGEVVALDGDSRQTSSPD